MVGTSNQSDPENPSDMKPHQTLADDMPSVGDCRQEGKAQVKEDSFQNAVGFRPGMDLVFRSRKP